MQPKNRLNKVSKFGIFLTKFTLYQIISKKINPLTLRAISKLADAFLLSIKFLLQTGCFRPGVSCAHQSKLRMKFPLQTRLFPFTHRYIGTSVHISKLRIKFSLQTRLLISIHLSGRCAH
jgi:hypothetical protein